MQRLLKKENCSVLTNSCIDLRLQRGIVIKETSLPSVEVQKLVKLQTCWEDGYLEKLSIQL